MPATKPVLPLTAGAAGSFAYVDSTGTQLRALDSLAAPVTITSAICAGGAVIPVRYDRMEQRKAGDTGRQVAKNFGNEAGQIFVTNGRAPADKTCYLSGDSALIAQTQGVMMRAPAECSAVQASRVAAVKARAVIHCWHIASAAARHDVLALQFANIDTSALASLALVDDSSVFLKDFPAVYHGPASDTWRADDEGVFSPQDFEIIFAAATGSGYVLAFAWAGAEGQSSELLLTDAARGFRTLTKGFRYWSPT